MSAPNNRLLALDVIRGITIAGMILVNNPGSWQSVYAPLQHARWHGLTPTDLVYPFFMFIMGVAIHFSLRKFDKYNPQNEMFRLLGTKRSFSQNETFFFSHPYPPTLPFST